MARRIETSIVIDADPERVWDILTDSARMSEWNPFITAMSGPLEPGARLLIRINPPGKSGMTFKPTVITVRPNRELRWIGRLLITGLFDGEHYFLLEQDRNNSTRFIQGETFTGALVGLFGGMLTATEAGFRAMNEALKAEAEKLRP